MFKSNVVKFINNSSRILATLGLMLALAVTLVGASGASANTITPSDAYGKLTVYAVNSSTGARVADAQVAVVNQNGDAILKGTTNSNGEFASYVPVGTYKVRVMAAGYLDGGQMVTIKNGQGVQAKIALQATK